MGGQELYIAANGKCRDLMISSGIAAFQSHIYNFSSSIIVIDAYVLRYICTCPSNSPCPYVYACSENFSLQEKLLKKIICSSSSCSLHHPCSIAQNICWSRLQLDMMGEGIRPAPQKDSTLKTITRRPPKNYCNKAGFLPRSFACNDHDLMPPRVPQRVS